MRQDLAKDYASLVPEIPLDEWRRIRGEQEVIASYAPDEAIATLPKLLNDEERSRLLTLIDRLFADHRIQDTKPTAEQLAMVERVRAVLSGGAAEPGDKIRQVTPASQRRNPA
jgi:nitrogen-specific signal transduction histidine kinase